jgi:hypothetical protein
MLFHHRANYYQKANDKTAYTGGSLIRYLGFPRARMVKKEKIKKIYFLPYPTRELLPKGKWQNRLYGIWVFLARIVQTWQMTKSHILLRAYGNNRTIEHFPIKGII